MRARPARKAQPYPVEELIQRLEAVYGRPRHIARFTPMEELVSCILSQHSSDANSFPAFTKLLETYNGWDEVVAAGPEKLAEVVRGAGLANQKSRNIVRCLEEIRMRTGDYSLEVLRTKPLQDAREWLMSLPGVGPKTASIVLCFSFGMGAIPVDTHVYRVSWRLGILPEGIGEAKAHDLLLSVVPEPLAYRFHVTLLQHGRQTCKAPLPLCDRCPVTDICAWYKAGGPTRRNAELQARRSKKAAA